MRPALGCEPRRGPQETAVEPLLPQLRQPGSARFDIVQCKLVAIVLVDELRTQRLLGRVDGRADEADELGTLGRPMQCQ